ncbi:MAG: bifunctional phosphoribosylaminoimidazolecarboxamide formyltransferase/IMP cyclohydrolase [Bacteroidales bacterium]|nr:bifunctional phosphoribosylaminoimidazolecarboxamide formyltransferase/IMP cyclohydrolase [Bacteroidales bacterium]MBN2819250.1 bifunctional phosphoribosylaminoimidazolecarboxamide formyltransferase/IMP cyclohydrolase [Bacteroidales bacterium]
MSQEKVIKTALISVYHKDKLDEICKKLNEQKVKIISTGGTKEFIEKLGIKADAVEDLTSYPSILGGRVKTLHPKVFGGILSRRDVLTDNEQLAQYEIPEIDLVIVDLYPFEQTVASGASDQEIIEKIDIGGISLIRAAAKNFKDVVIVPSQSQYATILEILNKGAKTTLEQRKELAMEAFQVSSHYDTAIFNYFNKDFDKPVFKQSIGESKTLRYGENPHQKGVFYGNFGELFEQVHGKEISYNNLLDIEAAVYLIDEFDDTSFAILKHNNACGLATRTKLVDAYTDALAGDPVSAFGGILITNREIDVDTATEIDKLFCEVVIAPSYDKKSIEILKSKKNRIILIRKDCNLPRVQFRTLLNGVLLQDRDLSMEGKDMMTPATKRVPTNSEYTDLEFANKLVKHTKSNTIVLAKGNQLLASGVGQTSRVDALKQAIEKAKNFGFDLRGSVMASDAFFPFPDCVEIANAAGITAVVQPGGSIRDKDSIEFCDANNMAMVLTGVRHFKH